MNTYPPNKTERMLGKNLSRYADGSIPSCDTTLIKTSEVTPQLMASELLMRINEELDHLTKVGFELEQRLETILNSQPEKEGYPEMPQPVVPSMNQNLFLIHKNIVSRKEFLASIIQRLSL